MKRPGKCMGNLLQLVSITYCVFFQHQRSSFLPLCWEVSFTLSWMCAGHLTVWRVWPPYKWQLEEPVPCLCHRVKELLTIMDFSFVCLSESMLCFCLPRRRPCSNISSHRSSSSHIFFNLFPLCLVLMEPHPWLPLLSPSPISLLLPKCTFLCKLCARLELV